MEPKEVFESSTLSVWRVMQEPHRGLYIPPYQRPFSWQTDMATTLLSSICSGIRLLQDDAAAVTALGTLIFVRDNEKATVEPAVKGELPSSVFLVIDGQQRLSTLAILVVLLDERLARASERLPKNDAVARWAARSVPNLRTRLQDMVAFDRGFGDGPLHRQFPRIIRAFEDSWSTFAKEACYESPIASLLHAYIKHLQTPDADEFRWHAGYDETAKLVDAVYEALAKGLDHLAGGRHDEDDPSLPPLAGIANNPALHERFFDGGLPDKVQVFLRAPTSDPETEPVQVLARTMLIARYLLDRVAVTQVEVKREAYAFDLFESINTSGDPLTAYETFKPHVIRDEGLEHYRSSASYKHLTHVDRYFDENAGRRAQASHDLLIRFALFEKGDKLGTQLREQRHWLRRSYDELGPGTPRHHFLQGMATVARFLTDCWQDDSTCASFVPPECLPDFRFCLAVLRSAHHEVAVPLLARHFEGIHAGETETERLTAGAELTATLRAVTAFLALWRGSRVGTKGIDSMHRELMSHSEQGFKRQRGRSPTATAVRAGLRNALADERGGISGREAWIEKAARLDVYKQSPDLSRLLLLAAGHDAVPDPEAPGMLCRAKSNVCSTLTREAWDADYRVGHVAPTQMSTAAGRGWSTSVYLNERLHKLGNLWLLPSNECQRMSSLGWSSKRMFCRALAARTTVEAQAILAEPKAAAGNGMLSEVTLANARFLPHIHALAGLGDTQAWDAELVDLRSRNIASMAWDRLAPWLGIDA